MAAKRQNFSWDHPVVVMFIVIAVIASMSLAAEVLKPLALSVLLCFILAPVCGFLEKRGLPRVPAVMLTVILSLGTLGLIGVIVGQQLSSLAEELPKNEANIIRQVQKLQGMGGSKFSGVEKVASDVAQSLEGPRLNKDAVDVRIVSQPSAQERLRTYVGPYIEYLGVGSFVLILVLFMLIKREDLGDRIIQLIGHRRISLTTRTMDEVGHRISKYLAMFAMVNTVYGIIIGTGLYFIGVPYAVLWGFLAAGLRFIPYVGAAIAFFLPLVFSIAHFGTWRQPLEVVLLFGLIETIANSFLEPIIYGKTTGVSALGLIVAAMFWTWLWGTLGLLLSTPMTVCLAVLGKYVPSLGFFATLLGEEAELEQDVRFYQRLLALDQDGAAELIDAALKQHPRAEVFDQILVPTLSRAERDFARNELDEGEQAFIWRVVDDIVDDLKDTPDLSVSALTNQAGATTTAATACKVVGIAANDRSDALVLKMLAHLLSTANCNVQILEDTSSPLKLMEEIDGLSPTLLVLSHLPPSGLTPARYLVKRLRARFKDLPIVVGRWGERDVAGAADQLSKMGATAVVPSLVEARDRILTLVTPKSPEQQKADLVAAVR